MYLFKIYSTLLLINPHLENSLLGYLCNLVWVPYIMVLRTIPLEQIIQEIWPINSSRITPMWSRTSTTTTALTTRLRPNRSPNCPLAATASTPRIVLGKFENKLQQFSILNWIINLFSSYKIRVYKIRVIFLFREWNICVDCIYGWGASR